MRLDAVAHRAWSVVELGRGRGEEAAAGEHLALGVVDHVVAQGPDARKSLRRLAGGIDDLLAKERCGVVDGGQLQLLLRAKVGEETALAQPVRLGEPADGQRLEALLGSQLRRARQDRVPRSLALRFQHGRLILCADHVQSIEGSP